MDKPADALPQPFPRPARGPSQQATASRQTVAAHLQDTQAPPSAVADAVSIQAQKTDDRSARSAVTGDLPDGARIGQYELIRALGQGGMGAVHLARDLRLGRLVAMKFLTIDSAQVDARFLAEARATARCQHEHIVVIYDVGEHDGRPFMVLEFLRGQTLAQWRHDSTEVLDIDAHSLRRVRTPLPPARAVELLVPVVRALVHAHELGVVHRDLKPSNIVLTDAGTIKVLDFGIAKLIEGAHAEHSDAGDAPGALSDSTLAGTPAYMAPEQLNCEAVDHRADLWAVGVMLFELVMGHHPAPSLDPSGLFEVAEYDTPMPRVTELRPRLGAIAGIIDRCLIKDKELRTGSARELLAELEPLLPRFQAAAGSVDANPFAGLSAFQERDADRFFGRDREIATITARLRSHPLVAITGPSGVGKSSVVRAGVIPALKRAGQGWDVHIIRPGRQPISALVDVLCELSHAAAQRDELRARLRDEPGFLGAELRSRAAAKHRRALVFVDQFEELFTMDSAAEDVRAFIACLDTIADDASSPLRLVLSVRSDFLDRVAEHQAFMAELSAGLLFLPPLNRACMREALDRPVHDAGYRFEDGVVDDMLDHVEAAPGALPLLQFAASHLWSTRDQRERLLTRASYDALGGLGGALATHADHVLAGVTAAEAGLARAIFERLVTPERTRAVVSLGELCELGPDPHVIERLVNQLVNARLLSAESTAGGARLIELVHESLIERWPRLAGWLDENREDAAFLDRLRTAAAAWENSDHANGMLWRGEVAQDARRWYGRYPKKLPERSQRFLKAVFALDERASRRKRRAMFSTIAVLAGLLGAAAVVIVWMLRAESEMARQNQTIAQQRNELQLKDALERALGEAEDARASAQREKRRAETEKTRAEEEAGKARDSAHTASLAREQAEREKARALASEAHARKAEARAREAEAAARRAAAAERQAAAALQKLSKEQEELLRQLGVKELRPK